MNKIDERGGKDPDIQDMLNLQFDAWSRLADLIGICTEQRDAGNLKVAHGTYSHARRLLDEINALEQIVSPRRWRGEARAVS
jgi:hypothetical protein